MASNIKTYYEVDDGFIGTTDEIGNHLGVSGEVVRHDIINGYRCRKHHIKLFKRVAVEQVYELWHAKDKFVAVRGTAKDIVKAFYGNYTEDYIRQVAREQLIITEEYYIYPTNTFKEIEIGENK